MTHAFQPRNVLVPTDFSPQAQKAVTYAQAFAEHLGVAVHLVHIVEPVVVLAGIDAAAVPPNDLNEIAEARQKLASLAKEFPPGSIGGVIVREGLAVEQVLAIAKDLHVELIILSTHGHSRLERVFFGSTAEGIIRKAESSVLVLRPEQREFIDSSGARPPGQRFTFDLKNILVPFDFSDPSRDALAVAADFARRFGSKLICLHALDMIPYVEPEMSLVTQLEFIRKNALQGARRALDDVLENDLAKIPNEIVLTMGSASREIIQTAEDREADLIVMGTHGKKRAGRFLLGSTTERVVRHARTPVLVVRQPHP